MTVQDLARALRTRWKIIFGAMVIVILGALAYSYYATPQYQASTRLYVTFPLDGDGTQTNNGDLYAQRQVLSYIQLLEGEVLAQRTVDKLNLDMSAADLQQKVEATAPTDTVVIDVMVLDSMPARARDIANMLSAEFVVMAAELSTPDSGVRPNARVIIQQRANIPEDPVTPKTKRNLAIAAVLGAIIGAFIALIRDRRDATVRSPQGIEKATGLGVIGEIPFDSQLHKSPLIPFDAQHPAIAEAFRELRTNVQCLEVADGPRVILVASPLPNEGRTTTAANLSLAFAQAGYDVVVVDGDLRNPQLASLLGLTAQVGLSAVLTGVVPLDEALVETGFPRLRALTSGPISPGTFELLSSPAAKEVLGELGRRFDYVVVDSPPMLVTDSAILARNSQAVLMVARFGRTDNTQLMNGVNALRRAGAHLIGVVLAMTPANRKRNSIENRYFSGADSASRDPAGQGARRRRGRHSD